jgi:hypothetical protein
MEPPLKEAQHTICLKYNTKKKEHKEEGKLEANNHTNHKKTTYTSTQTQQITQSPWSEDEVLVGGDEGTSSLCRFIQEKNDPISNLRPSHRGGESPVNGIRPEQEERKRKTHMREKETINEHKTTIYLSLSLPPPPPTPPTNLNTIMSPGSHMAAPDFLKGPISSIKGDARRSQAFFFRYSFQESEMFLQSNSSN